MAAGPSPAFELNAAAAGSWRAQGALTFASASRARELGLAALTGAPAGALEFDCGAIAAADSAGLAVLIDWLGYARAHGRTLHYRQLPQGIAALARISEVEELLARGV
jgi:phospholipid transport system transporter-binding protein